MSTNVDIVVKAKPGSLFHHAFDEARAVAEASEHVVTFQFNDTFCKIDGVKKTITYDEPGDGSASSR